jgi:uncharacterized protein (TIGR02646 family)
MRWVDIYELEFPPGWHDRATQALNELRKEIENAEFAAQLSGEDVATARKKAISAGLNKEKRKKIWRDLAPYLGRLRKEKCWYSESKNSGSDKDVDHFRPKNAVAEDPSHEGYWWRAFDWRNYRYSCKWCNQRRVDVVHSTDGGKWDYFPIGNGFRARLEGDNCDDEWVNLLDPTVAADCKLLTFRSDGHPTPAKEQGTREYERAKVSIWLYHLDRKEFVNDRKELAGRIKRIVQYMETLRPCITDLRMRMLYLNQEMELFRLIGRNSDYSSAALAYARAEVYTIERGHQVKREWLEEILNSNP